MLPKAREHLRYWQESNNKALIKRIALLIKATADHPYQGIGKPEPQRFKLSGKWSRRIDKENRIVYSVIDEVLAVYALKGHY